MAGFVTHCKYCCFYDKDKNECKNELYDTYSKANAKLELTEDGYSIDRICLYKRTLDWNEDKSIEEKISLCKSEVYITGTILLITHDSESLSKTIETLNKNLQIDRFKFIILFKDVEYSKVMSICGNNLKNYKLINILTDEIEFQIHQALNHAKNGYIFIIDCNKEFDELLIDKVDNLVNKCLIRLLHIPGTDGIHQSVSMIHIYKWLKGDLGFSFEHKLRDISSQEDSDPQIISWKEVNEKYCNKL